MKPLDPRIISAIEAVIAQGKPSVNEKGNCLYRGPDGLKCLVGHMITDDEVKELRTVIDLEAPSLEGLDIDLLYGLQRSHDLAGRHCFTKDFILRCADVLSKRGYELPECLK